MSLSGAKRTDNLSRIKKESAETFGSKLPSCPKILIQRHSEVQPKNPRKTRLINWILRFVYTPLRMTIPVFAWVVAFGTTAELRAENAAPTSGFCNDDETCLWSLATDGTMTISAAINPSTGKAYKNVSMKDYSCTGDGVCQGDGNRPWEENIKNIKNLVIGDNIETIGANAFQNATSLQTVTGMKDVKTLKTDAFWYAPSLNSIYIPKVENIGTGVFYKTNLTSVDIPNAKSIGHGAFLGSVNLIYAGLPEGVSVSSEPDVFRNTDISTCGQAGGSCGSCGNEYVMSGMGCVSDCGAGYLGKEGKCISAENGCGENYKDIGGWCNRIRYTPAEAAAAMNGDDNTITLTFRK